MNKLGKPVNQTTKFWPLASKKIFVDKSWEQIQGKENSSKHVFLAQKSRQMTCTEAEEARILTIFHYLYTVFKTGKQF